MSSSADPKILPDAAVTVAEPKSIPVASPVALIVALDVSDDIQVTCVVRSRVLLSEYVPVAVNCFVLPFTIVALCAVTSLYTTATPLTSVPPNILHIDPFTPTHP